MAQVKCQRCGDSSHVTADCPMKDKPINKEMDKEYLSFMAELGEPGAKDGASFCAVLCCVVLALLSKLPLPRLTFSCVYVCMCVCVCVCVCMCVCVCIVVALCMHM